MEKRTNFSNEELLKIQDFLSGVQETNEDTEYDADQEYIVNAIIGLVTEQEKTSIKQDFDIPYIHPMITIQKWNAELKDLADKLLNTDYL